MNTCKKNVTCVFGNGEFQLVEHKDRNFYLLQDRNDTMKLTKVPGEYYLFKNLAYFVINYVLIKLHFQIRIWVELCLHAILNQYTSGFYYVFYCLKISCVCIMCFDKIYSDYLLNHVCPTPNFCSQLHVFRFWSWMSLRSNSYMCVALWPPTGEWATSQG